MNPPLHGKVALITGSGRGVVPEDVTRLVAFLCGDEAAMVVGQTITIDGGYALLA